MSEERKGHMKMVFEVEMNKEFMDVMKEGMSKMHWRMPTEVSGHHDEEKK